MTASLKGTFDPDDVNAYLAQAGRNSDDHKPPPPRFAKEELNYFYRPEFELSPANQVVTIPKSGNAKTSTVAVGQCICMDVGCWTGRGIAKDGRDEKRDHHRHREFGVVCGRVAVLCCYPDPGIAKFDDSAVDSVVRAREEYKKIRSLLEKLTHPKAAHPMVPHPMELEAVKVLQAMAVDDLRLLDANVNADDLSLHVFLGDLHLPVVGSKQTSSDRPESGQPITRWSRLDFSDEFGRVLPSGSPTTSRAPA